MDLNLLHSNFTVASRNGKYLFPFYLLLSVLDVIGR